MTDMNKEVPNPVYNYMNSDADKRIAEMHTKGLEMVFDSIVGRQPSTPMEMIYKQLGWQGGTIHQVVARIKELMEREQELAESMDERKNNTEPQDGGGNNPETGNIEYKPIDFEEIRKRKRANFKKALLEVCEMWPLSIEDNIDLRDDNVNYDEFLEDLCKATIDKSLVN